LTFACLALMVGMAAAAEPPQAAPAPPEAKPPAVSGTLKVPETVSTTGHTIQIAGKPLAYTAHAGSMEIKDPAGKPQAEIFFTAYIRSGEADPARPITFVFNGGPGAASLWLHLGALGPRRIAFGDAGTALPETLGLVDNESTWLDFTDLVFIDPVGTGFSRAAPGVDPKRFQGVEGDVQSVGEFIRLYVTHHRRWLSPKFIAGESYGSTRAAGLSSYLQDTFGMNLRGLVLISSVLDFQAIRFHDGNDLPYVLYLPSYTAVAWYHKRLAEPLQSQPLDKAMAEAEEWANGEYRAALFRGDALPAADRDKAVERLARYTGLTKEVVSLANLRISGGQFVRELLKSDRRVVGTLDGRVKGISLGPRGYAPDPSLFITIGPLVSTMLDYLRKDLLYDNDLRYEYLSPEVNRSWNWGSAEEGYVNVAGDLRQAMSQNTQLRVLVACGYYDLATAWAAQKHTVNHLGLDPSIRDHIRLVYYPSGHQLYTNPESLKALKADAEAFYRAAK
jgi:carboxypeptidase C (cathepsin A)